MVSPVHASPVIDRTPLYRPRVSRETRQLLVTALLAVAALWVLARVRYPDQPAASTVSPLLTQLAPRAMLTELAAETAQLRVRIGPSLLAYAAGPAPAAALRIRDDTAVAWIGRGPGTADNDSGGEQPLVKAHDRATGLAVVPVEAAAPMLPPMPWTPRELDSPRYLLATIVAGDSVALRPVYIAALQPIAAPAWSGVVWLAKPQADLQAGTLLFTTAAEIAGLVVPHGESVAIVPSDLLLATVNRLVARGRRPPGSIGVDAEPLTRDLAVATGARTGVILSWIDPQGPAAGQLVVGDVVEAVEGQWVESHAQWDARVARLGEGDRIVIGVRRQGEWRDVQLVAAPLRGPAAVPALGLELRNVAGAGSEVVHVERLSAAAAAGLQPGDIITLVGGIDAPSPAQVRQAFAGAAAGRGVIVAFARGTTPRVTTLRR
jgi:hypothetical protein